MSNQTSAFVKIIKEICREEEISIASFSCDFMFRLVKNGKINYIFGYQFGLNSASSHMICEDKSTTSELLSSAGIPNVEHRCFMSPTNMKYIEADGNWKGILSMMDRYQTLVLKDNKGTGGLSVYRAGNAAELENVVQILFQSAHSISVSPYYDIIQEYRLVILDGDVKLVYHKDRKHLVGDGVHTLRELYAEYLLKDHGIICGIVEEDTDRVLKQGELYFLNWKHNLGQGASPVFDTEKSVTAPLKRLAKEAASCVGVRFASVDIVQIPSYAARQHDPKGDTIYKVLEVNSGVMMEYLAQSDVECRKMAKEIYREAILKMME